MCALFFFPVNGELPAGNARSRQVYDEHACAVAECESAVDLDALLARIRLPPKLATHASSSPVSSDDDSAQ
jgi:hypothetical protein